MTSASGAERLRLARKDVERVCQDLASPSTASLDRSVSTLESTCTLLANPRGWCTADLRRPEAVDESRQLYAAVRRVSRLLRIAQDYHARWSEALTMLSSSYTPSGVASPTRKGLLNLTG